VCKKSIAKRLKNASYEEAVDLETYQRLLDENLLEETPSHIRLTEKGWPLLDQILSHLLLDDAPPPATNFSTTGQGRVNILPPDGDRKTASPLLTQLKSHTVTKST
jgi:hypothetical protein